MSEQLALARLLPDVAGYIDAGLLPAEARPLAEIVGRHAAIVADVQALRDTISDLTDEQRAAEQRDAAALKAAALSGEPLPALESEDAGRRIRALRSTFVDFKGPLSFVAGQAIEAAEQAADACTEHLDQVEAERQAIVAECRAALEAAEASVEETRRLRSWLTQAADRDYWSVGVPNGRGLRTVRLPDETPTPKTKTKAS